LVIAEQIVRDAQQLPELADVVIGQAELSSWQRNWIAALQQIEEALAIARSRQMRLRQADALLVRGRMRMSMGRDESARIDYGDAGLHFTLGLDDAELAHSIAVDCGYLWAVRDSLLLRAGARNALGRRRQAQADREAANRLTEERLRLIN
jgi:hypothetical protein